MFDKTEEIASKHLGKKSLGSEHYDSSLLVAIPRCENRKQYSINDENLPFKGFDIWHGYEFSVMTEKGVPVTRVLKLKYSCESNYLVESKSLKLYLNSFNMSRFGQNIKDCLEICKSKIEKDLGEKLETKVELEFLDNNTKIVRIFDGYKNLFDLVNFNTLLIDKFKEAPEVLKTQESSQIKEHYLTFDSLRSNCRVTHQPDFGDAFIYYESKKHIDEASLFQYLTSFRAEYHFHEECTEMIFKRLKDLLNPDDKLLVCALYTRRGGIDINPVRWTSNCNIEEINPILNLNVLARYGIKQ